MSTTTNRAPRPDDGLELNGHRALVTGGTKGIGAAVVTRLREAGVRVLVTARTSPAERSELRPPSPTGRGG